jgi:CRP-like cAMP-binding protein
VYDAPVSVRAEITRLKETATRAIGRGAFEEALAAYQELERLEPASAHWPKRIGEMYRRLGRPEEAVAAWTRAAERFAHEEFLLKAIAICHLILRHEPENPAAQRLLVELNQQHGRGPSDPSGEKLGGRAESRGLLERAGLGLRGAPLVDVPMVDVVIDEPATREVTLDEASGASSITEIPINWEPEPAAVARAERAPGTRKRRAARDTLARTPLFSDLPGDSLEGLIGRVALVEVEAGEVVFREGEVGDALYVVAEGRVAVRAADAPEAVAQLGEGEFFGEIALVTDDPRTATVEAIEATQLLRISRDVISDLIRERRDVLGVILSFLRERLVRLLVATSPLFAPFVGEERRALARRFRLLRVGANAELVKQGARSAGLFVLLCGSAEVLRTDDAHTRRLAVLRRGDVFGEISLLTGEEAIATVKTKAKLLVLELSAADFREVIMTHPQVLAFVGDLSQKRRRALREALAGGADYAEEHIRLP